MTRSVTATGAAALLLATLGTPASGETPDEWAAKLRHVLEWNDAAEYARLNSREKAFRVAVMECTVLARARADKDFPSLTEDTTVRSFGNVKSQFAFWVCMEDWDPVRAWPNLDGLTGSTVVRWDRKF
jgi:hypothetical protein